MAYCTVSMLRAALEILYAGVGMCVWYFGASVIEPSDVELTMISTWTISTNMKTYMLATFFKFPFLKSGKIFLVTKWAPKTLLFKMKSRLFLFKSDGYLN